MTLAGVSIAAGLSGLGMLAMTTAPATARSAQEATGNPNPALTVSVTSLQAGTLPVRLAANGNIEAWQEAIVGAEANGLRLAEVQANVGDKVRRGQTLARFAAGTTEAGLAQSRAAVAEAELALAEAVANAQRARELDESGALSAQQMQQYATAAKTAQARLDAAIAAERLQALHLSNTHVVAPDDGVISSRAATVGAVVPAGQELFRLIRGNRLEWRAELPVAELDRLKPGDKARITLPGGAIVEGRLRVLAPMVNAQTRNGLAYVDLLPSVTARAGSFARGEFELGSKQAMTLPQTAVLMREGFSYVMRIGPNLRVMQTRVRTGLRTGDRVEILHGITAEDHVVATGAAFLGDGDLVRVVRAATTAGPASSPTDTGSPARPRS
ncbi:MAG: efflux RND transporter periplasmic adaptor subunit [Moraxellaceae bacterium]|nr:efflux RND transporter periplasmic adaptor subunit [Moraxellaceae bacterium]